jgi:hypothetical protein
MIGRPGANTSTDFAWYLFRGAVFVGLALAVTFVLHQTFFVRSFERANLDAFAVLLGRADRSDRVAVVVITDRDYADIFGRRSPLDRKKVEDLVRAIDQASAAVIGVDILTEEWPLDAAAKLEEKVVSPIVWVRDLVIDNGQAQRERPGRRKDWNCRGPGLIHEVAGVARDYERRVRLNADDLVVPSFTEVIESVHDADYSRQPCRDAPRAGAGQRDVVPFAGRLPPPRRFPASAVLAGLDQPAWKKAALLGRKIVLLGGAFDASRDYYATPFEERAYGVDILARIIAADLAHQQIKMAAWWAFISIDAALGFILVLAGWFLSPLWLFAAAGGAVVLVLGGSMFLFQEFLVYLSFIPVLLGVGMHFVFEHFRHTSPVTSASPARRGRRG